MKLEIRNLKLEEKRSDCIYPISNLQSLTSYTRGFTLVEILVAAAVFLVISLSAYNAYISLFKLVDLSQYRVLATALANEQFEIARNMPYADVGVQDGIPDGKIPQTQVLTRAGIPFTVTTIVRNI